MVNGIQAKAHHLLGQLGPSQLAVVVQLLEVMIYNGDDELTEEYRRAVTASRQYFQQGGAGLSLEQVADQCGFTMDEIRIGAKNA